MFSSSGSLKFEIRNPDPYKNFQNPEMQCTVEPLKYKMPEVLNMKTLKYPNSANAKISSNLRILNSPKSEVQRKLKFWNLNLRSILEPLNPNLLFLELGAHFQHVKPKKIISELRPYSQTSEICNLQNLKCKRPLKS